MSKLRIERLDPVPGSDTQFELVIEGAYSLKIIGEWTRLTELLMEFAANYDFEPVSIQALVGAHYMGKVPSISETFPMLAIRWDDSSGEFTATTRNGDTGTDVFGHGERAIEAVADLVRNHGFKSNLHNDTTDLRLRKFLEDMNYGFNRISDELLAAELDGIVTPDKGSW